MSSPTFPNQQQTFAPLYIFPNELDAYGLPQPIDQPDIMKLVGLASSAIDEWCGRIDTDGSGSLVYTTYVSRLLLPTRNRNLVVIPMKPLIGLDAATVAQLQASGAFGVAAGSGNCFYTGCMASSVYNSFGQLSPLIGASGRYGYTRQDMSIAYPDLFAMINPLNLITMFGGPAPWVPLDIANTDIDPKTGEAWIPSGLQLQRYSEVLVVYTAGFDPRAMPPAVKLATAAVVKNAMAKGGGTTAMTAMSLSRSGANVTLGAMLIDPVVDAMLTPFKIPRAY